MTIIQFIQVLSDVNAKCEVAYPVVIIHLKRLSPLHPEMIQFVTSCHTCISALNHHSTNKFHTTENIYVLIIHIT